MKYSKSLIAVSCLALLQPAMDAAAAQRDIILAPQSNWLVDWEKDSCLLVRKFGDEKNPFVMGMRTYAPGYSFQITLTGALTETLPRNSGFTVSFGPGEPIPIMRRQRGSSGKYGAGLIFSVVVSEKAAEGASGNQVSTTPYPDLDMEKRLDRVTLGGPSTRIQLQTGPMTSAMNALRKCTDDLAQKLGLDPAVQHSLRRPVQAVGQAVWARSIQADYPDELKRQFKDARVIVRAVVDANGKPTRCDAFHSFANTDFKDRACAVILDKARFEPALDKDGNPVASIFSTVVTYTITQL